MSKKWSNSDAGRKYHREYQSRWRQLPGRIEMLNKRSREYRRKIRMEVLNIYGNKCVCCEENRFEFLSFDHINGGGTKQYRKLGTRDVAIWIRKNNYPKDIRILCHNCNQSRGAYGFCPHELERNFDG